MNHTNIHFNDFRAVNYQQLIISQLETGLLVIKFAYYFMFY